MKYIWDSTPAPRIVADGREIKPVAHQRFYKREGQGMAFYAKDDQLPDKTQIEALYWLQGYDAHVIERETYVGVGYKRELME